MKDIVCDTATDKLFLSIARLKKNPHRYMAIGKANGENHECKTNTFTKAMYITDKETFKITNFLWDLDSNLLLTEDATTDFSHLTKCKISPSGCIVFSDSCNNSGGCGTKHFLM